MTDVQEKLNAIEKREKKVNGTLKKLNDKKKELNTKISEAEAELKMLQKKKSQIRYNMLDNILGEKGVSTEQLISALKAGQVDLTTIQKEQISEENMRDTNENEVNEKESDNKIVHI